MTEQSTSTSTPASAAGEPITPERFSELATAIESEVGRFIVGQQLLVRQTLISLLAGSHALLEGVPGLGKTMLVRTMSEVLEPCTLMLYWPSTNGVTVVPGNSSARAGVLRIGVGI